MPPKGNSLAHSQMHCFYNNFYFLHQAECISQVEPEASGSGTLNVTTGEILASLQMHCLLYNLAFLDIPGSAVPESTCKTVERKLTTTLNLMVEKDTIQYNCTTKDRVKQCKGKCTYCGQGCQPIQTRTIKRTYECKTDSTHPYLIQTMIPYRKEIQEHVKCACIGKRDSES